MDTRDGNGPNPFSVVSQRTSCGLHLPHIIKRSRDVWVKLAEDGYSAGTWAVDTLITNKGKHSFTLPSVLDDGDYLLRGEIMALREANAAYNVNSARGAQFYMECVQVTVTGGGSTVSLFP
jgi:hypothetical protein